MNIMDGYRDIHNNKDHERIFDRIKNSSMSKRQKDKIIK